MAPPGPGARRGDDNRDARGAGDARGPRPRRFDDDGSARPQGVAPPGWCPTRRRCASASARCCRRRARPPLQRHRRPHQACARAAGRAAGSARNRCRGRAGAPVQAHVGAGIVLAPRGRRVDPPRLGAGRRRSHHRTGSRVRPDAEIEILQAARSEQGERVTVLLHKPVGYVSGRAEDGYEPAAVLFAEENHWQDDPTCKRFAPWQRKNLAPAGRLDIDSTGLLVLTQDGRVARQLIGEDSTIEKEYRCGWSGMRRRVASSATWPMSFRPKASTAAPRPLARRRRAQARQGQLAERRAAALRAARRPQAPDPPHVRAGRPRSGGPEARAHGPHRAGRPAGRPVALPRSVREVLRLPPALRRATVAARVGHHGLLTPCCQEPVAPAPSRHLAGRRTGPAGARIRTGSAFPFCVLLSPQPGFILTRHWHDTPTGTAVEFWLATDAGLRRQAAAAALGRLHSRRAGRARRRLAARRAAGRTAPAAAAIPPPSGARALLPAAQPADAAGGCCGSTGSTSTKRISVRPSAT